MIWQHSITPKEKGKRGEKKGIRMRNFLEHMTHPFWEISPLFVLSLCTFFSSPGFFFFTLFLLLFLPFLFSWFTPLTWVSECQRRWPPPVWPLTPFFFYFLVDRWWTRMNFSKAKPSSNAQKSPYPQSKQAQMLVTKRLKNCYNNMHVFFMLIYSDYHFNCVRL